MQYLMTPILEDSSLLLIVLPSFEMGRRRLYLSLSAWGLRCRKAQSGRSFSFIMDPFSLSCCFVLLLNWTVAGTPAFAMSSCSKRKSNGCVMRENRFRTEEDLQAVRKRMTYNVREAFTFERSDHGRDIVDDLSISFLAIWRL